jgi:signal transduction histidine kinase
MEHRGKKLLGLSKPYALLLEPQPADALSGTFEELDTRELLHDVRDRASASAKLKGVDVLLYCTCTRIWALPALSEALYQLLENAIRATREGHPVVVDARDTNEGDVLFHVQDTGVGMRPRVLGALAGLASHAHRGTGRGIARAWAIVELHGGLLRFESSPGVGTTATTWFPKMAVPRLRASQA